MPQSKKDSGGAPNDPPKGNPPEIDPDNPKPEDIKNLQRALSEKDLNYKKLEADLKTLKDLLNKKDAADKKKADEKKTETELALEKLKAEMAGMSKEIQKYNDDKKKAELAQKYPDILPELLIGKTDEEIKDVAEKQRQKNKQIYGDSKYFIRPAYESADDIDKEIEAIKKDKSQSGDQGALKVMKLLREKLKFNN